MKHEGYLGFKIYDFCIIWKIYRVGVIEYELWSEMVLLIEN